MSVRATPFPRPVWSDFAAERRAYPVRLLAALVLTMGLVALLTLLPLHPARLRMGWNAHRAELPVTFDEVQMPRTAAEAPPATRVTPPAPVPPTPGEAVQPSTEATEKPVPPPDTTRPERPSQRLAMQRAPLAFAENMPTIRGGLGAFYIHIEYPKEAVEAGIEGRLVLDFVVDTEGRPHSIHVLQSLHPACDSAAVRALRETLFMPGRQDGEPVPVRMRLPVMFRLVDAGRPQHPPDSPLD
jgi:protein TonB